MRKNVKTYSFDDESILGEGGFARVFLARNEGADTDAALKILKPEFEDNSYVVESFFRDPTVMRALDHKNIIKILDVGAPTEKPFYLSMEYCQGGDLRRVLQRKGRLAIASVLGYAVTLCDALAYCHRSGVFHRDIKASNVLFRDDQTPVLSDFGTGIGETERANAEKHNIGSPPYLGPEVWESKDYDATSDLYSMGVLLYYALTSRFPFVADSAEEYRRLHLSVPPVVPSNWRPGITKALDDIILSLLEKDPKNRIARADDLKENLDRVLVRSYAGHQQQNLKAILFSTGAGGNGTNITTFPYRIGKMEEWSGSERNDFIVGGEDPFVSRFHAVIDRIDDAFLFTDVSTNGSSVNGIHIHKQSVELLKTNEIVLGSKTALRLEVHPEEEPERNNNEDGTSILAESVEDLREKPGRKLVSTAAVLLALIVIVVLTHFSCM